MQVLALADDVTGALEAGAKFAASGISAKVAIGMATRPRCELLVIDTETRHLPADAAARVIEDLPVEGARIIYKKTDSTLRGNIAAELHALCRMRPDLPICFIPSYPQLGRTVSDGLLHVHGVPVHETAFAADPLNPIRDSSVANVVRGLNCRIFDGASHEDVARAVRESIGGPCILAGPASVAEALAAELGHPRQLSWPRVQNCAIVNGSLHEVSARQVARALERGCPWDVLRAPAPSSATHAAYASLTGCYVREYLKQRTVDALMVFGGDTAFGILDAVGCRVLEPLGEIVPGVPVSQVPGHHWHLITKAGGFGEEDLILSVKDILDGK
jgi:uncharacterized protein YgbK (DUF1537 family)